ncbi:MAG: helix-turn-helix domain-containing protein [Rickettsiales bacterium]|nr:helix-turn-helix domain-containing protein [Rickettsiales bacterium]
MELGISLIDKASKACGSDSKLADRMGIHRVVISEMRNGKRTISPATAAELADIAGEDAREAAIAAVIESARGTRREGALREILGKALAAGVAAVWLFSYSGDSISATKTIAKSNTIVNCSIHRIY